MATPLILAVLCGVAVALQSQFMGEMSERIGTLETVFITYGSGGIIISLILLFMRGGNLEAWRNVPAYMFITGILGLIIVGTISYIVPRLGLVTGFTILLVSQFTLAALIDHFGFFGATARPIDLARITGLGVTLVGLWLLIRP